MASAPSRSGFVQPASLRRRATSLALAILANALLLWLLFTLAPALSPPPRSDRRPTVVTLTAADDTPERTSSETRRSATARPQAPSRAPVRAPRTVTPPVPDPPVPPPLNMIVMSRETFAAADIATLPASPATGEATAGSGSDRSGDSKAAAGRGPGGQPLYNAEWYRPPSDAELNGYLPPGAPRAGWALIACRTIADYRVEDCAELGQSPPGSGLARAVRQAAWQFRVRPPRIGGKPLVGAWVSIRIDFSERASN